MPFEVVRHFGLQVFAGLGPLIEEVMELFELNKEVFRRFFDRGRAAEGADRIDQVGRRVGSTAFRAVVSVLVSCFAVRASSFDETIGQEGACDWVEELFDVIFANQIRLA